MVTGDSLDDSLPMHVLSRSRSHLATNCRRSGKRFWQRSPEKCLWLPILILLPLLLMLAPRSLSPSLTFSYNPVARSIASPLLHFPSYAREKGGKEGARFVSPATSITSYAIMQGFSGADLASLMREAAMCALKESLAKDRANLGQVIARSFTSLARVQ
jgi:hypothetical protein